MELDGAVEIGDGLRPCAAAGVGLNQIKKPRVFFMGLPVKMRHITASWVRAVALEEID